MRRSLFLLLVLACACGDAGQPAASAASQLAADAPLHFSLATPVVAAEAPFRLTLAAGP